jgi:hypothetical protein
MDGKETVLKTPATQLNCGIVAVTCLLLVGCGGGGGSSSPTKSTANSKTRLIETTRLSRAILAVTGLGRTITRSATPPVQKSWSMSNRISLIFTAAAAAQQEGSRTAPAPVAPSLDPGTGLYYTTTLNPDGSGEQFLFVDQALTQPAGFFKWSVPQWATATPGTYPAIITVTYSITAGNYAGVSGTMTVTVNDPKFTTGLIELTLTDSLHESASATLALSAEGISGKDKMLFGNGDSCTVTDTTDTSGDLVQAIMYPDGCFGDITTDPDGDSTETYTNPDATLAAPDLNGSVQPDGSDTIDDNSGDSTTVNVDPGDDSGDDSGGDSSGGDASSDAVVHKAAKLPSTGTVKGSIPSRPLRP